MATFLRVIILTGICSLTSKSWADPAADAAAKQVIQMPLFPQPLVWVGPEPSQAESQALLDDIDVFKTNGVAAGFKALEQFVADYPQSGWTPDLQIHLAEHDRARGRYAEALDYWKAAWEETKQNPDAKAQQLAVRDIAGWTRLLASLGQKEQLEALFTELSALDLRLGGYSTEIEETKEGLGTMKTQPGKSYRCGSYALGNLALALHLDQDSISKLFAAESPDGGFTISELLALAKTNGLAVEAVRQPAGAPLVVPSIVHWKLNHYAAIMQEKNGRYLVQDPTFEHNVWMDEDTINAESSGDYILPKESVPAGWQELSPSEGNKIYGKGYNGIFKDTADLGPPPCWPKCKDYEDSNNDPPSANDGKSNNGVPGKKCPPDPGLLDLPSQDNIAMPGWYVSEPYITLWLEDTPLLYHESYDRWMELTILYQSRHQPLDSNFPNFGPGWGFNWEGYLETDGSGTYQDFLAGGGVELFATNGAASYLTQRSYENFTATGGDPPSVVSPTGSKNIYGYAVESLDETTNNFLTQRLDRYGRVLEQFDYTNVGSVVYLVDAVDMDGQTNYLAYTNASFPASITSVTDRYGRISHFYYDTNDCLTNMVDAQGMSTYFKYDSNENITNMITPYGTNIFKYFDALDTNYDDAPARMLSITEASGDHQLYAHPVYSIDTTVGADAYALSYHWNRAQYETLSAQALTNVFALTNSDYENASVKAWLYYYYTNLNGILSDTLNSSMDAYDPNLNFRPNQMMYQYVGEGGSGFVGSMDVVTNISVALPDLPLKLVGMSVNSLGRLTAYTDFSDNGTLANYTNFFDSSGTILQHELGPQGQLTRGYGYDSVITNLLISVTNAVGDVVHYTHDTNTLKVTSTIFPGGMVETNAYYTSGTYKGFLEMQADIGFRTNYFTYTNGNVFVESNELGLVTIHTYDNLNRLTGTSYPDSTTTSNVYDNLDIVATKDHLNQWTYYDYNSVRQLVVVTNADGQITTFDYCGCGSPDEINQWDGTNWLVTLLDYDMQGRLTNVLYPDRYDLAYTYDPLDRVATITDSGGNELTVSWNQFGLQSKVQAAGLGSETLLYNTFDQYGRAIQSTDRNGVMATNEYDLVDRLIARQYLGSGGMSSGLETFGYSPLGLTNYVDQLGHPTIFVRDLSGRVIAETNANNEVLQFGYNAADELMSLTDGKNQATTWNYDMFGRVTNKVDAAGTVDFVYQYDPNDRLTNRWTPAKGTTVYRYDPLGNLMNVDYSAGSVSTPSISYFYDPLNRLTSMVDGIGLTAFAWTPGSQLASENGPWANDTVSYSYNGGRERTSMTLLQPDAAPWTQSYGYDSMMRLTSVVSPAGGGYGSPVGEFDYDYTSVGGMDQPDQIVRPSQNGNLVDMDYDAMARPKDTAVGTGAMPSYFEYYYHYNAGSELTQQVFAANNYINYTYDNIGQIKSANGFESNGTTRRLQEQFGYAYDKAWNLNERTNNALIQTFAVNNVNELTNASRSGTLTVAGTTTEAGSSIASVTVNAVTANEYLDGTFAATNFTSSSGTNTYTAIAEDDLTPPRWSTNSVTAYLPSSGIYTNDYNGNLTSDGTRNFAYDDENELVGLWVANTWSNSFAYDGLQRKRIEKDYSWTGSSWTETNEVHYVYDGNLVFQERDGNNIPLTTYTRGIDLSGTLQGAGGIGGLLARSDRQRVVPAILTPEYFNPQGVVNSYYSYDANGNVATLVSPYGILLAQYEYDPFGNMISMSGLMASMNKYRFSTKEWNDNEGLYYYGYRFYDPNLQRWLNRDPMGDPVGTLNLITAIMPGIDSPTLFDESIGFKMGNDSVSDTASLGDWSQVNANFFTGIANDPVNQVDFFGLDANSFANCVQSRRNPLTEQIPNAISNWLAEHLGSGSGSAGGPHVPGWVPPAAYTANAVANELVGPTGRTGLGGLKSHPTDWQHKLGSRFGATGSKIGRFAGRAAVVLTVAEGFWDIGTIAGCGIAEGIQ